MELSLIINTYERPASLARCLAHVAALEAGAALEVIVLDDGSQADYAPVIAQFAARLPLRYERIAHGGYSRARNAGVALARARRIWFLGDDVMLPPGALACHRAVRDPLIALLGPYPMRNVQGSPPFRHWLEVNPLDDVVDPNNASFAHFITGNLSMDRGVFEALGGFDEAFTLYGWEDIDLGIRFEERGGRVVIDAAATAAHEHPPISRAQLWRRERCKGLNGRRFYEKWKSRGWEFLEPVRLWPREPHFSVGPEWRLRLGDALAGLLDRVAPGSRLNWKIYERMVHASRLRGFAEAAAALRREGRA